MKDSAKLVQKALCGIRPERTPIFDLLTNDVVIEHFSGLSFDTHDPEIVCTTAIGNALDANRAKSRPRAEGNSWFDFMGNEMVNDRWTCWVQKHAISSLDEWVDFIKKNIERLIDLCVSNGTIHNLSLVFLKKDRNSDCWERI